MPGVDLRRLPAGLRDCLPEEAVVKRRIDQALAELFTRWSYREVITPTLERAEVFGQEGGRLFQFIDQGELVALRPEMTASVARLAATYFPGGPWPQRLFYLGQVFRQENQQAGRLREFSQAGVELLGAAGAAADAEVITLAVEALRAAGLEDFRLGLGHVGVTLGLVAELGLPPGDLEELKKALAEKNHVAVAEIAGRASLDREGRALLDLLTSLHGGEEVFPRVTGALRAPAQVQALQGLEEVWRALVAAGLGDYLFIDLGLLRDLDYYTGIVFEGYAAGLGFPVCGGGRYDQLGRRFGLEVPATGFALGLERVLQARRREESTAVEAVALVAGPDLAGVLARARALRAQGQRVEMDLAGRGYAEAQAYAARRGIPQLVWVE